MSTFNVKILAADAVFYEGPCESLVIPVVDGQYGILPNHCNTISAVIPGILSYRIPGQPVQEAAVSNGLMKIENNEVLLLIDSVELPEEIDENRAKQAVNEAQEELLQRKSYQDYRFAQAHLARAINRLAIKRNHEHH